MSVRQLFSMAVVIAVPATLILGLVVLSGDAAAQGSQPSGQTPASPPAAPPAAAQSAATAGAEEVVMTVGDRKITVAEFERIAAFLPAQFGAMLGALGKRGFADQYGNLLGLAMEGEKRQLDQDESFRKMMEFQRLLLLGQLALNDLATKVAQVSVDEVRYYYTTNGAEFEQAKLRGIYIPYKPAAGAAGAAGAKPPAGSKAPQLTEEQARMKALTLRGRIRSGENFATLAKTESDHPTASKGGDFGYVRHGQFAPQLDNAIFALQAHQISAPIKDRFGYFIFEVEEKRAQPFEEAQPIIENNLRQHKLGEALAQLKEQYPVTLDPRYFPETAPAQPPAR